MNEINAAQRMRMAAKEKAEADRVMVVTRAQGASPDLRPPSAWWPRIMHHVC